MRSRSFGLIFIIVVFAATFFVFHEFDDFMLTYEQAKNDRYEINKNIFDNIAKDQKDSVSMLSMTFALDSVVKEAYKTDDPEMLKKHLLPIWNTLKNDKLIHEIHFFKPPAISFVNFSNFASIGKDVSDVRKDIEWVTQSFKSSQHLMFCKTYAGFRATTPIVDDNGVMLGGLSMGKKIDWLPQEMKDRTGDESFLVYKKEAATSLSGKYYDAFLSDKTIFGSFILGEKTIPIDVEDLSKIDFSKEITDIEIDSKNYVMNKYNVIDFNGDVVAYLFTINDFKSYFQNMQERMFRDFLVILIASIIIYLITTRRLKRMILQSKIISNITQKIKKRDFSVLKDVDNNGNFEDKDILNSIKNDVIDMGETIQKKYFDFETQLITQLYTDNLTSLGNRNALMRDIDRYDNTALVLFNVRSFKQINEAFGFETGNLILVELSQKIKKIIQDDIHEIYRIGGDEFGILFHHNNISISDSLTNIQNSIEQINNIVIKIDDELDINISIYAGVCFDELDKLVKADMALTQAKKEMLDVYVYTQNSDTKQIQKDNISIYKMIREAIKDDNVVTVFQPIVEASSKKLCKYEALVRIKNGDRLLTPYMFLGVAMKTKSYHDISRIVITKSIDALKLADTMISININAIDLKNKDTLELITQKVANNKLAQKIVFELTETDDLYSSVEVIKFISDMKKYDVKIAIDDFGTGYSNFSYIMKMQPDYLKIDGSLIKNINTDENSKKIVKSIVQFCKELEIKTIAEFVHSQDIADICTNLGIDELQGYYYGEPNYLP